VPLDDPEIGSTDPNIPTDNDCTDDELYFRMPGGCQDCTDDGDEIDEGDAISTTRWRRRPATELVRLDLGTSDVDGYKGETGDIADAGEMQEVSEADDGSMQYVKD
jgi:hypothetical protein